MWVYVGRRLLLAIPTLLGASIIVFAMVHLAPGDPIAAVMPAESSKAEIEATKRAYGFDKPLPVQYLVWLGRVATGDFGKSIATRRPVILDVRDALANSLVLALSSSLLAFVLGVGLGLLAALSSARPCLNAASNPNATPSPNASNEDESANTRLFARASRTSRMTGRRVAIDLPRSPVTTRPSQTRYCTGSGLSNP